MNIHLFLHGSTHSLTSKSWYEITQRSTVRAYFTAPWLRLWNRQRASSLYGLTKRFVIFGDFNFDAIFIVDVDMGGIVGQLILNDEELDPENQGISYQDVEGGLPNAIENWTKPIGITTCDSCLDLWMTSHKRFNFYRIRLTRPLMEMADNADFTEFADSIIEPYDPWGQQKEQPFDNGQGRYMAMKRDGSVGFFPHRVYGLFQFLERNEKGENVLEVPASKMIANDSQLMGVLAY